MDEKDKILIYELGENARMPYSKLSKKLRIPQETIRYRIQNLIKSKVIKNFILFSNLNILGYSFYQLFFKLQNMDLEKEKELIEFLKEQKEISWVAQLEGNFDLGIILVLKNQIELKSFMKKLYSKIGEKIMKKTISLQLEGKFFNRNFLINKRRVNRKTPEYKASEKEISINKKDLEICRLLSQNARMSYVELGSKINLSADAIIKRVKNLEKLGIIAGSTIDIDRNKIKILHYKILLKLNDLSEDKINIFSQKIGINKRVIALVKTLAEWDYEIDFEVENVNQIKEFTRELSSEFPELIKDYEILRIVDMPKYDFFSALN